MTRSHIFSFSVPCVWLSPGCKRSTQKPGRLAELRGQGRRHLELGCSLAESQVERLVLFKHPWAATSWNEACLKKMLAIDGKRRVRCNQFQFGKTPVDVAGNVGPARKATGFMTNHEYIAEAVDRRCSGGRDNIQLLNSRAKACEKYLPRLVAAILRALRQSMRAAGCGEAPGLMGQDRQLTIAALHAGPTLEEPELLSIPDSTADAQEFRDRSFGLPLNPEMVKRARELEMQHMGRAEGSRRLRSGRVHDRNWSTTDPD